MSWIERETEQARIDGVQHPENFPYLLLPEHSNGRGMVMIHGFGATPRQLRNLATVLAEHGFTVAGIRLPGHGTSPEDLKTRRVSEWLLTARAGHAALTDLNLTVGICGLSTGALLALFLAAHHSVEKLLLLSPFLRLRHRLVPLAGALSLLVSYQNRPVAEHERDFYYSQRPLQGVAQINRLRRELPRLLPHIKVPALILTSTGDTTIAPGTAQKLYRQLGSPDKSIHTYGDHVPHVLTSAENPELGDVLRRCIDFLKSDAHHESGR